MTGFSWTVVSMMTWRKSAGLAAPVRLAADRLSWRLLEKCHEPLLPHALTPARQRGAIKGQFVLEELLSAEELKIGVLDPALTQHLIGEVVHVLENGEPRHQACG